MCGLLAKPFLTGDLLVISDVHLLASVHPTPAIYQDRLMVAPFCAHASMGIMDSKSCVNVLKSEVCSVQLSVKTVEPFCDDSCFFVLLLC